MCSMRINSLSAPLEPLSWASTPDAKPEVTYTRQASLSIAKRAPPNKIAYLKLNLEIERVVEFFESFWLWRD